MALRVCALLLPRQVDVTMCAQLAAQLRATAMVARPDWQRLSDIEILEQVLRTLRDHPVTGAINKESTTTQVGSLSEEI